MRNLDAIMFVLIRILSYGLARVIKINYAYSRWKKIYANLRGNCRRTFRTTCLAKLGFWWPGISFWSCWNTVKHSCERSMGQHYYAVAKWPASGQGFLNTKWVSTWCKTTYNVLRFSTPCKITFTVLTFSLHVITNSSFTHLLRLLYFYSCNLVIPVTLLLL